MGAIPVEPVIGRTTRIGGTIRVLYAPSCYIRKAE